MKRFRLDSDIVKLHNLKMNNRTIQPRNQIKKLLGAAGPQLDPSPLPKPPVPGFPEKEKPRGPALPDPHDNQVKAELGFNNYQLSQGTELLHNDAVPQTAAEAQNMMVAQQHHMRYGHGPDTPAWNPPDYPQDPLAQPNGMRPGPYPGFM